MIFTIGTSNRTLSEFVGELENRRVTHLVDVRSSPWSKFAHFSAPQISQWTNRAGIFYRQAGGILGGRSPVPVSDPSYIAELEKLISASCREQIAIFCSEGEPEYCHRSYAVAASLLVRFGVVATNILRDGSDQDVTETLARTLSLKIPASIRAAATQMAGGHLFI